jgi:hypothetical protein
MSRMPTRVWRVGALALVCLAALSGAAMAANSLAPQLRSPVHGKAVVAGHKIKLVVYVPDPSDVLDGHVFVQISDKRVVRHGALAEPKGCGFRCDFTMVKRVGHTHMYTYVDPYHFPGNWQDTAGRYYWQAFYYPKNPHVFGTYDSTIGTFRVIR